MFIFESFTYNEEEAKKLYGGYFSNAKSWIDSILIDEDYISQFNTR